MSLQKLTGFEEEEAGSGQGTESTNKKTSLEGPDSVEEEGKSRETDEKKANYTPIIWILIFLIVVVFSAYTYLSLTRPLGPEDDTYPYSSRVLGIDVKSKIPFDSLQNFKTITLLNSSDKAIMSCNYELSALSVLDRKAYLVKIEQDNPGVYIRDDGAWIRGRNNQEVLTACTVFACLREGITCPENLMRIPEILASQERVNLIIDGNLGEKTFQRGIVTIGYAMGMLQSQSKAPIYTWLMYNNTCFLATVLNTSGLSKPNGTEDVSCDSLGGIYLLNSDRGEIKIHSDRIMLEGNDDQVYAETVIVQNIIAPNLRERLSKVNIPF